MATSDYLRPLDTLYRATSNGELPVPDIQELFEASQSSRLFVLCSENDKIVAVGGTFYVSHACESMNAQCEVIELGGMASTFQGLKPLTAQQLLIAVRALALSQSNDRATCVISTTVEKASKSKRNLQEAGLEEVEAPEWLSNMSRTWLAGTPPPVFNFLLRSSRLRHLRDRLVSCLTNGMTRPVSAGSKETNNFSLTLDQTLPIAEVLADASVLDWVRWEERIPTKRLIGPPGKRFIYN